ncbi:hypothetical protein IFR05_016222 [Cadophora sp. M221]|nr:hypothetical protein IFR05_016222 [Cadophora sp. M221]
MLLRILTSIILFATPSIQNTHYADQAASIVVQSIQPCHLYGDPDIYGIGIRISFYLQWFSILVAVFFNEADEIVITRRTFNVVALAVLINTYISTTNGSLAALEVFIVCTLVLSLSIYCMIPFGGSHRHDTPSINPFESAAFYKDPIGIGILLLIDSAFLLSQPWLYFVIIRQGTKPTCAAKIWIFKPINIYSTGWIGLLKAISILGIVGAVLFMVFAVYAIGFGLSTPRRTGRNNCDQGSHPQQGPQQETVQLPTQRRPIKEILLALPTMAMAILRRGIHVLGSRFVLLLFQSFAIAFVEMTIRINDIDLSGAPLTATSQLLPFLVGVFSLVSVVWASIKPYWENVLVLVREEMQQTGANQHFVHAHEEFVHVHEDFSTLAHLRIPRRWRVPNIVPTTGRTASRV